MVQPSELGNNPTRGSGGMKVWEPKTVSVVMPVFNERRTIASVVERVKTAPSLGLEKELVIVDDGSTDGTCEWLQAAQEDGLKAVFHPVNRGKGAAVRSGFATATGDVMLVQDADLEYDPDDYAKLLRPIVDGKADVVFGSRFVTTEARRVLYFWHSIGNRVLTVISNAFTNLNLSDMETGYKVFTRPALAGIDLKEDRFGFEPEIVAKVARKRLRVYEVGISYSGRTYAEGKKIKWTDGVRAVYCIVKYSWA
jgi:glycosyltransferase involved in cell wall biosynthesis